MRSCVTQILIRPSPDRWSIHAGGTFLGESSQALELREGSYQPVLYFPRADIAMDLLERTDHATVCPHKGVASYFSIVTPSGPIRNAVWSYEAPKQQMGAIAGYLAFYPDRVTVARQAGRQEAS